MNNLITNIIDFSKDGNGIAKRKWLRFAGLTILELIMVTLLAWPFLETTAAHPALPGDLEQTPQMIEPAEMGPQIDPSLTNNGPQAAIPALQGSTSLTVSIEAAPEAVKDSNLNTASGKWPEVYVIEAVVTNTGSETAEDVVITLNYNVSGSWVLVTGEDPIRTVSSLAAGATTYVYWFAQHQLTNGATHKYTVSAVADNAPLVSTSENKFDPNPTYTVKTVNYIDSGNQGLDQSGVSGTVGVAFTTTQVYTLGNNVNAVLLNPVGNTDFDAEAYRLLKTEGHQLDGSDNPIAGTDFVDEVYITSIDGTAEKLEVTYTFLALLPKDTTACPYLGIKTNTTDKYDENYCSGPTTINIDGGISLAMTKKVNTVNIQQGGGLQYTINYTNSSLTQDIGSAWIWDDVPTGVSILTGTISPGTYDTNETTDTRVAWNIGTIPANSSGQLSFTVSVDGGGADIPDLTKLVNEANFGINPGTTLPARTALSSTVTTTVHAPVIAMTKTDGATTANPGDSLTYVIQITNTGSNAASGLVLTDVLPSNIILGTPNPTPSSQNGQTLVWNSLGTLAANGGTLTVNIPYQIDPELSVDGTVLTDNAELSYKNASGAHTFTSVTAQDTTTVIVPTTSLTLTKTAQDLNGPPLIEGDIIRYTVQIANSPSFTAYNVVVTDDLPDEVTCQSVTGGPGVCADPLIWNVGNLGPSESQTMLIDVKINQDAGGKQIINSVSVTSTNVPTPPPDPEVCPDGSIPSPNCTGGGVPPDSDTTLDLSKTAVDGGGTPDVLEVGDTITYTLMVTNTGNYTAYNVVVTDDLSEHVSCQNVIPGGPGACSDPIIWNVGDLAKNGDPGDSATLMIIVEILPSGENQHIINSAVATGTNVFDPPPVPEVCPDGSTPTGGLCPVPDGVPGPDPNPGGVYLPILIKN